MKRIFTVLTLMFIHLCGHSQVTTYKEVDRYNNEGTANNVVVLQMNDDSLPFDPDLTQEARKHRGHQNLTVVFYRASAALLPFQKLNTCTSYSQAQKMAQTEFYYAIYTYNTQKQGAEKITFNPRYR